MLAHAGLRTHGHLRVGSRRPGDRRPGEVGDGADRHPRRHRRHHRSVGPAPVRLRDRPQDRGLLRRLRDHRRRRATSRASSGPCASRTRSSATSSSACPTGRPLAAACSATARPNRLRPGRESNEHGRQHRHRRRQRHPRPRAAVHAVRAGHRHLRAGRQPPLAEPPDPGVGGAGLLLRRHLLGAARPRTWPSRSSKGSRVIVTGRLEQRSWETEQGDKRSKVEIIADEVGPSLRWATAEITTQRAPRRRRRRPRRWRRRRQPSRRRTPAPAGYDPDEEPF